jgi:hypothetical protein
VTPPSVLAAGGFAGLSIGLAAYQLRTYRPDLAAVARQMDATRTTTTATPVPAGQAWPDRVGARLLAALGASARLPYRDLNLLGISPAHHLGRRTLYALAGGVLPHLMWTLLALAGAPMPFAVPLLLSVGVGALMWIQCDTDLRKKAVEARQEFRHASVSFLERVALARLADAGAADAMHRTAAVGDGRTFDRIRAALDHARLAGRSPWDALGDLAEELDIPELARLAETVALAGEEGATIHTTAMALAKSLRVAILTDAKAKANRASELMVVPMTCGAGLLMFYVVFPAFSRIMNV